MKYIYNSILLRGILTSIACISVTLFCFGQMRPIIKRPIIKSNNPELILDIQKELNRKLNFQKFAVPLNIANKKFSSILEVDTTTTTISSDLDRDGLSDIEESTIGTDANNPDTDGDGLLDSWEVGAVNGINLNSMGASPLHKDIFVVMDYMVRASATNNLGPNANVLLGIEAAFANWPVINPDRKVGINIHLIRGKEVAYKRQLNPVITDFILIKQNSFDILKAPVFHYMIWADTYKAPNGDDQSSGYSFDIPSSNFIVTLGQWNDNLGGNDQEKIGTFIHELGHNLGLLHGGNDDVGFKPNHLSVMNYFFQMSGVLKNGRSYFTYQSFALPSLDESNLNEAIGLGNNRELNGYSTFFFDNNRLLVKTTLGQAIDWNQSGNIDNNLLLGDLNGDFLFNTLEGSPNELLKLNFKGGSIGKLGSLAGITEQVHKRFKILPSPELSENMLKNLRLK